jgi:hypothetical protein
MSAFSSLSDAEQLGPEDEVQTDLFFPKSGVAPFITSQKVYVSGGGNVIGLFHDFVVRRIIFALANIIKNNACMHGSALLSRGRLHVLGSHRRSGPSLNPCM